MVDRWIEKLAKLYSQSGIWRIELVVTYIKERRRRADRSEENFTEFIR